MLCPIIQLAQDAILKIAPTTTLYISAPAQGWILGSQKKAAGLLVVAVLAKGHRPAKSGLAL